MEFEGSKLIFENFGTGMSWVLWLSFSLAFVMGAVVHKTNFCTMGAISDVVNMGDTGRWRAWVFAMAVAIIGVIVFEKLRVFGVDSHARPPYRNLNFRLGNYLVGGLLFGIGMTFGSGCGNKTLIRIGGGNIKSIFVLLIMGIFAYWMILGFGSSVLGTYPPFSWINNLSFALRPGQDIGSITAATSVATSLGLWDWFALALAVVSLGFVLKTGKIIDRPEKILTLVLSLTVIAGVVMSFTSASVTAVDMRLYAGGTLAFLLLIFIFKSKDFTSNFDHILGGLVVGLAVLGMWYVNSAPEVKAYHAFDEKEVRISPAAYVMKSNWKDNFQVEEGDRTDKTDKPFIRPDEGNRNVGPQGMTFVSPSGWLWNMIIGSTTDKKSKIDGKSQPFYAFLNVPLMILLGVIAGSFFWALIGRSFRIEWFASSKDFFAHVIGATMMGVGGVMALGCTIGQGVTGVSTLALGSFIALFAIYMGAALSMKVQLYKMVYEDAGFGTILVTSLADMKLLPKSMKKLEAI